MHASVGLKADSRMYVSKLAGSRKDQLLCCCCCCCCLLFYLLYSVVIVKLQCHRIPFG